MQQCMHYKTHTHSNALNPLRFYGHIQYSCVPYLLQGLTAAGQREATSGTTVRTQEEGNRDVGNTERHLYLHM